MSKRTGPTNPHLVNLIADLKKKAIQDSSKLWKRLATDLERPTRNKRIVNLSRINRFTRDNETIVVPGKVLGSGMISHKVTIAAFAFSDGAVEKLKKQNCSIMSISELMQKSPKTSEIRIIG
ncbi:50S ribosomal protein L18e [Candidatus Woesearchaeota archaeon]|jgi:large subunit ribosomal protein L18e|nr:50S ribosomal protein L18e [Candidatus Woesearchaeota archaeon]